MQAVLRALLEAHDYVHDLDGPSWEFAVEMATMRRLSINNSDLRWLIGRGLVEHAVEITRSGDTARGFRQSPRPVFSKRTCFILTPAGVAMARGLAGDEPPAPSAAVGGGQRPPQVASATPSDAAAPRWERDRQELRVGAVVVKRFKLPAADQEAILAAFEEGAWPERIDNPLPSRPLQRDRSCLQIAIEGLNRNQIRPLVRFTEDGNGLGVCWKRVGVAMLADDR